MPNKIEQLADGKVRAELETGEVFEGDALTITQKMADAHVNTKRWGQDWKSKYEAKPTEPPAPVVPPPPADANQAQLQSYLLEETAKALGYENGPAYKADLLRVKTTSDAMQTKMVAADFMQMAPDFPNTPQAIEALAKEVEERGWDYNAPNLLAAHSLLIRNHSSDATKGYEPLTVEQQSSKWEQNLRESNKRPTPPPVLPGKSPDGEQQGFNPYDTKNVSMEQLRAMAVRQQLEGK